jgi:hypothetical protein
MEQNRQNIQKYEQ